MNVIKPTLLATLIYDPKVEADIYDKLIKHLARPMDLGGLGLHEHPPFWMNKKSSAFALSFPPEALERLELTDIALLQVGINAEGEVVRGWCDAQEKLAQAMAGVPAEVEEAFVGRTLVYEATIPKAATEADADELFNGLLHKLRLQEKHEHLPDQPVAASEVTGGKLWLLKSGRSGEENIYLALGREEEIDTLNRSLLFGYYAALIGPDAVAHKAYFMLRDYLLGDTRSIFRQASDNLMAQTVEILGQKRMPAESGSAPRRSERSTTRQAPLNQASSSAPVQPSQQPQPLSELDRLSHKAAKLTAVTADLRQLHSRLKIHRLNYQIALKQSQLGGTVGTYHRQQQNKILFRLHEDLIEAQSVLEATNTAINYLRADYERKQTEETRLLRKEAKKYAQQEAHAEKRTQDILAVIGVALSVAQIFTARLPIVCLLIVTFGSALVTWFCVQWLRGRVVAPRELSETEGTDCY